MKKLLLVIGVWLSVIMLFAASAYAATPGVACVQSAVTKTGGQAQMTLTCTAGTDNSFAATAVNAANMAALKGYWIDEVDIKSGGTAPTAGATVAITMLPSGQDILGGRGICSGSVSGVVSIIPKKDTVTAMYGGRTVTGTMTLAISGSTVSGAIVTVLITAWNN